MRKERPILMNGDMVRAILAGTKTQTRRPVASLLGFGQITEFQASDTPGYAWTFRDGRMLWNDLRHTELMQFCPFGQPGDRLWVRETGRVVDYVVFEEGNANPGIAQVKYLSDEEIRLVTLPTRLVREDSLPAWLSRCQGIPNGIFREAARIFLDIVSVRVERAMDISDDDARAEGFADAMAFKDTWEAIYGAKLGVAMWGWVWVVEFKRAEAK